MKINKSKEIHKCLTKLKLQPKFVIYSFLPYVSSYVETVITYCSMYNFTNSLSCLHYSDNFIS